MNLAPTSELEAVNTILSVIGSRGVSSLESTGVPDLPRVRDALTAANREVQARGWYFNTNFEQVFVPDTDGEIKLPLNYLELDTSRSENVNAVARGQRLYNLDDNTFQWTDSVKIDWIAMLPFEELPQAARQYITVRAARKFQRIALGSDTLERFTADDERIAYADLNRADTNQNDANVFDATKLALIGDRSADILWR